MSSTVGVQYFLLSYVKFFSYQSFSFDHEADVYHVIHPKNPLTHILRPYCRE